MASFELVLQIWAEYWGFFEHQRIIFFTFLEIITFTNHLILLCNYLFFSIIGNDTDEAQVIVQVQDGNDPPEFKKAQYSAQISEASPKGTKVVQVIAEDNDVRLTNSQFVYVIADGNENNTFSIGQSSGEIIVETSELDRESIANYNLTVQAVDNGSPPAIGETMVFIQLIDVNDSPPKLDAEKAFIKENSPPNR